MSAATHPSTTPPEVTAESVAETDWLLRATRRGEGMVVGFPSMIAAVLAFSGGLSAITVSGSAVVGGLCLAAAAVLAAVTVTLITLTFGQFDRLGGTSLGARLVMRRVQYRLRQLDRRDGWRPREGAVHPRGRTDTHDRYVVEVVAHDQGYTAGLVRWTYEGAWRRCVSESGLTHARSFCDDEDGHHDLIEYRAELRLIAAELEGRAHVLAVEQDAERRAVAERLAANERFAAQLNAGPVA